MRTKQASDPRFFRHNMTREYLERSARASAKKKLEWLKEMADFVRKCMPRKMRREGL